MSRKVQAKRIKDGTHHLLGPTHNNNRIANKKLTNLALKRNRIGFKGVEDLMGLLECPSIT